MKVADTSSDLFRQFLKAFWSDWSTRMSGPPSVPLAFIALFLSGWYRTGLLSLSGACFVFASFQIWKKQQREIAGLRVKPYEEAQRQLVLQMLHPLGGEERVMLQYFLLRGEREQQQIATDLGIGQPQRAAVWNLVANSGLLAREYRQTPGHPGLDQFWRIDPNFEEVLKDELFTEIQDPSHVALGSIVESPRTSLVVNLKRFLVLLGTLATLYFAVGTWLFPEWYYGIFWGGKLWNHAWWMDGVSYWADWHIGLLILGIVLAFMVALLAHKYRRLFLPFIDRLALRIVLGCCVAIAVTALLDYKYARVSFYNLLRMEIAFDNIKSVIAQIVPSDRIEQSDLEEPIYFQYLDRTGVEALYSQLEPELVERQRTISSDASINGKGSVTVGPVEGELAAKEQKKATSSFERASFSPERKCLEVMKFVSSQKPSRFYTTGGDWVARKLTRRFREDIDNATSEHSPIEVAKIPLESLRLEEQQKDAEQWATLYNAQLDSELASLSGLILIDGIFTAHHESNRDDLTLIEQFSEKPLNRQFRISAQNTKQLQPFFARGSIRLRVFGTVTKQLGNDGVIDVRAIAIY